MMVHWVTHYNYIIHFCVYTHTHTYISIIHPRCIKKVFSDATVFINDFELFLHHIGSDRNPGMTLEEPTRLLNRDMLRSCLYQSKKKTLIRPDFGRSYIHLSFSNSQWKTGHSTLLYYIQYHLYLIYIYIYIYIYIMSFIYIYIYIYIYNEFYIYIYICVCVCVYT